ncbi:MAG: hypothetical protein AB7F19_00180 [Candidatus Babeliales bacterium]
MNNIFKILCIGLFSLTANPVLSRESKHISITIDSVHNCAEDETFKQELFKQVSTSMHEICEITSHQYRLRLEVDESAMTVDISQEFSNELEHMLYVNLYSFVDACNEHATKNGHNVDFLIDHKNENDIAIVITCSDPLSPTYWQSIKRSLGYATDVVTTQAKNAGTYIKDSTYAGAEKVSDAAYTVKEKTKHGIHAVAEKVAQLTE